MIILSICKVDRKRNFEAVLQAMASGSVKTEKLISKIYPIDSSNEAYEFLMEKINALNNSGFPNKNINLVETNNLKENKIRSNIKSQHSFKFYRAGNYAEEFNPSLKRLVQNLILFHLSKD